MWEEGTIVKNKNGAFINSLGHSADFRMWLQGLHQVLCVILWVVNAAEL